MADVKRKVSPAGDLLAKAITQGAFSADTIGKVGWGEKNKYVDEKGSEAFVAEVAAKNEFGDAGNNQPPRPFMRKAIKAKKNAWQKMAASAAKRVLKNKRDYPPEFILEKVGLLVERDVRQSIIQFTSPSLSPATVAAREAKQKRGRHLVGGSSKPLVETGIMRDTLTSVVEKK